MTIAPHLIDLTPEEFRCAATMSCPRVLARAACGPGSCPAVLEGKADTLIIIGKLVAPGTQLIDKIGEGEAAIEIDRALVTQAVMPALYVRIAELEAALKAIDQESDKALEDSDSWRHLGNIAAIAKSNIHPDARAALAKLEEGAA